MMSVSRMSRFQSGWAVSGTSLDDHWNLLFFEIYRIEHPDDAIVKIAVQTFSRIVLSSGD